MSSKSITSVNEDNLEQFQRLIERPKVAWPTICLFVTAWALFGVSCYGYISGVLPLWLAILFNCIAAYFAFTVAMMRRIARLALTES